MSFVFGAQLLGLERAHQMKWLALAGLARVLAEVVSVKFSNLVMVLGDGVVNLLYQSRP